MIVVAIIGLLAGIAIPNFVQARTTSQMNACINNLIKIDDAKQQWAMETKQASNAVPQFSDISDYLKNAVTCPAGGTAATFASSYILRNVAAQPRCIILPTTHVSPRG
jgi:Tfp pilus assembly protein PilE